MLLGSQTLPILPAQLRLQGSAQGRHHATHTPGYACTMPSKNPPGEHLAPLQGKQCASNGAVPSAAPARWFDPVFSVT